MSKVKRKLVKKRKHRWLGDEPPVPAALPPVRLGAGEPCPCGSGKPLSDCTCVRDDGRLIPLPVDARPTGKKTGHSNEGCFARPLADCSRELSDSPRFPLALYDVVVAAGVMVEIQGPALDPPDEPHLYAPFVCQRHGETLAGLDAVAVRFFGNIIESTAELTGAPDERENAISVFNGHDIERWMLKTLIGLCFQSETDQTSAGWQPDAVWLEILFENRPFPPLCGLSSRSRSSRRIRDTGAFGLVSIAGTKGPVGVAVDLRCVRCLLLMTPAPPEEKGDVLYGFIHRPDDLILTDGTHHKIIHLGWDDPGAGDAIRIRVEKVKVSSAARP